MLVSNIIKVQTSPAVTQWCVTARMLLFIMQF